MRLGIAAGDAGYCAGYFELIEFLRGSGWGFRGVTLFRYQFGGRPLHYLILSKGAP